MIVSIDLLKKYNACKPAINFFEQNYPDGIEALEIIKDSRITPDMLHFAARYFPLNQEELNKYREICKIENSKHVFSSEDVINSIGISQSKHIKNSEFIKLSSQVSYSQNVYDSKRVENSNDIWNSKNIKHSSQIISSSDVSDSFNIMDSDIVSWSKNIMNSMVVDASYYIFKGQKVINSAFSTFIKNCNNCLFCAGIEDEEYMIFNEPVDEDTFEMYMDILQSKLEEETSEFIRIDKGAHKAGRRFDFSMRPDSLFEGLSSEFYGWVSTLPNFKEEKFFQIFFTDKRQR